MQLQYFFAMLWLADLVVVYDSSPRQFHPGAAVRSSGENPAVGSVPAACCGPSQYFSAFALWIVAFSPSEVELMTVRAKFLR